MNQPDLIKHTHRWVHGACSEWNQHAKQFADETGLEFQRFVMRVHSVVWNCLRQGQRVLDGTCSDLECDLGLAALKLFRVHLEE